MSFGFGVGDFALFTKFTTKVIKALRDEGGSKIEFQIAERQCHEFLSAAGELNRLDLSRLPESFRERLANSTANFTGIIKELKNNIESYEKSLSENSKRGRFASAPKKVQWALLAAGDLKTARESLIAQMGLIHLSIQTYILSRLTQADQSLSSRPSEVQDLTLSEGTRRLAYHRRAQIGWHGEPGDTSLSIQQIEGIADVIYERLSTRPGIPFLARGTVRTLPEDFDINELELGSPLEALQHTRIDTGSPPPQIQDTRANSKDDVGQSSKVNRVANEVNDYLRDLNLDALSEEEKEYVDIDHDTTLSALLGAPGHDAAETSSAVGLENNQKQDRSRSETRGRRGSQGFMSSTDHLSTLLTTMNIFQFLEVASKVALQVSSARSDIEELYLLSKRLGEYLSLTQIASRIIQECMLPRELQDLADGFLLDSKRALTGAEDLLARLRHNDVGFLRSVTRFLRREIDRKIMLQLIEEFGSLKSTISIMLQLHQINITERYSERREALSSSMEVRRV